MKKLFSGRELIIETKYKILLQNFAIYCSIYSVFILNRHYSNDTLDVMYHGTSEINLMHFRYFTYFIYKVFDLLHIKPYDYLQLGQLLLVICISFLSWKIYLLFSYISPFHKIELQIIRVFSVMIFANLSYFEGWFYFPETYVGSIIGSILFYFAFSIYCKGYGQKNQYVLASFVLTLCAINVYQVYVEGYVILCTLYVILKSKCVFRFMDFIYELKMLVIAGSATILNIISTHLLNIAGINNHLSGYVSFNGDILLKNIRLLIELQKSLWADFYGLMPKYIMPLTGVNLLFVCGLVMREHKKIECFILFLLLSGMYSIIFFPLLFSTNLWTPPRTIYGFFIFIASVFVLSIIVNNNFVKSFALAFSIILCISMSVQINRISINNIVSNRLDRETALLIQSRIERYELESNNSVTTIVIGRDDVVQYAYNCVDYVVYDTNSRGYAVSWNDINIINYYTGESYSKKVMTEDEYYKYFNSENYDELNLDEQLKFDGNCAYLLIF